MSTILSNFAAFTSFHELKPLNSIPSRLRQWLLIRRVAPAAVEIQVH